MRRRETVPTIGDSVPPLYRPLLPSFFSTRVPPETAAPCLRCPMLAEAEPAASAGGLFFSPATKCCTYSPRIPSFLVGGLLNDPSPALAEGKRRVRERINSRVGVTPWGLLPGRRFELLYAAGAGAFGRAGSLRCPYHDAASGRCSVRPWWEPTCHTWFCKHIAGEDGRLFWRALQRYFATAEEALVAYVLDRAGMPPEEPSAGPGPAPLGPEELDERPLPESEHRRLWGRFAGREEDYYRRAHRLVGGMTRRQFALAGGAPLALQLRALRAAHAAAVARRPPARLLRAPALAATLVAGGRYRLTAYSGYDPLVVSRAVFRLLEEYDGTRTNREVATALGRIGKKALPAGALLRLYQARVLVAPGGEAAGTDRGARPGPRCRSSRP